MVADMSPFPNPPEAPHGADAPPDAAALLPLVAVIELKWLAAGVGQHLHVERMQHDAGYARGVLAAAATSTSAPLRRAGARLQSLLDARLPVA
jgi:hypothetical protein